jgi:hypothetical protein
MIGTRLRLAAIALLLPAAACRLPARETRWLPQGTRPTGLPTLAERRAGGVHARLWIAERWRWPFPLPGSRTFLYGRDELFLLVVIDNASGRPVAFRPEAIRVRLPGGSPARARIAGAGGCDGSAAPGGRLACGVRAGLPRGLDRFELDLSEAVQAGEGPIVFQVRRESKWTWRRVGPGLPLLFGPFAPRSRAP